MLILLLLLRHAYSGLIYAGQTTLTYPVVGLCTQFQFNFALQSGLGQDEFIQIVFPFTIHRVITDVVANLYSITSSTGTAPGWNPIQTGDGTLSITQIGTSQSQTSSSNIYTFNFNQTLTEKTWYQIQIITSYTSSQTSGYKNPIRMLTISSLTNGIIYDDNYAFTSIVLAPLPQMTLQLKSQYTQTAIGQPVQMNITITPSTTLSQPQQFLLYINNGYTYQSCESTPCSCSLSDNQVLAYINCTTDMFNQSISLNMTILNAKTLLTSPQTATITGYSYLQNQFLEYGQLTQQLSLSKITLQVWLQLLWGVNIDSDLVNLYVPASSTPVSYPFNSVFVYFNLTIATPSNEMLITITTGDAAAVLESSIAHNLGTNITCYWNNNQKLIYCKNIQSLNASTAYYVAFKCAFPYGTLNQGNFGFVSLKTVIRTQTPYLTYLLAGPVGQTVAVKQSQEYLGVTQTTYPKSFGNNYITSGSISGTFTSVFTVASPLSVGLTVGSSQRIMFYITPTWAQQCSAVACSGNSFEMYMRVLFNKNQIISAANMELSYGSCGTKCTSSFGNYNIVNDSFAQLWCSQSNSICTKLFDGVNGKGFGIQGTIQFHSSIYPSQKLLDFVIGFYSGNSGIQIASATQSSASLIQGYTISSATTIKGSFVNYYYQNTASYPTMLRILGSIPTVGQHVVIFVDGGVNQFLANTLAQFQDDTGTASVNTVSCSVPSCIWYPHRGSIYAMSDIYVSQRMLLIANFTGSTQFDALFQLITTSINPQSIVVASVNLNTATNAYDIVQPIRVFGAAMSQTILTNSQYYPTFTTAASLTFSILLTSWNLLYSSTASNALNVQPLYKVSNPTAIIPGQSSVLQIVSDHTDANNKIAQNSGTSWGAGFVVVGLTLTAVTWTGGVCTQFNSIVFCPYDLAAYNDNSLGNLLIGTFKSPVYFAQGTQISFLYSWSNQFGQMTDFKQETQLVTQSAKTMTATQLLVQPNSIRQPIQVTISSTLNIAIPSTDSVVVQFTFSSLPNNFTVTSCDCVQSFSSSQTSVITLQYSIFQTNLTFYATHTGTDTASQTFSTQLYYRHNNINYLIDQSIANSNLSFSTVSGTSSISVSNYQQDNFNYNSRSWFSFDFWLNGRQLQNQGIFTLQLGFLALNNAILFSTGQPRCLFIDTNTRQISRVWSTLQYNASSGSLLFTTKALTNTNTQTLNCTGILNADPISNSPMTLTYSDSTFNVIQSGSVDIPQMFVQYSTNAVQLTKYLNGPGFGAYYEMLFTPVRTSLYQKGRIVVEFSSAIQISPDVQCLINATEVDCSIQLRRIYAISTLNPLQLYNLTIGPIQQPRGIDTYGQIFFGLWVGTGFTEQYQFTDTAVYTSLPSLIPFVQVNITATTARTTNVYITVNMTLSARTVNVDKYLIVELTQQFSRAMQRSNNINCRLYQLNDNAKTNLSTGCYFRYQRLLVISMMYDANNAKLPVQYILQTRFLITPDLISQNPLRQLFPQDVKIYFVDLNFNPILASPPVYAIKPMQFIPSGQVQFNWYIYDQQSLTYTKLEQTIGFDQYAQYTIQTGVFSNRYKLFLGLDQLQVAFLRQVQLTLIQSQFTIYGTSNINLGYNIYNNDKMSFPLVVDDNVNNSIKVQAYQIAQLLNSTTYMTINIGDYGYWFDITSQLTSGVYYLQFTATESAKRTTFIEGQTSYQAATQATYYSLVPLIAIRIDPTITCSITFSGNMQVPVGGSTIVQVVPSCTPQKFLTLIPITTSQIIAKPLIIGKQIQELYSVSTNFPYEYQMIFSSTSNATAQSVNVAFSISGAQANLFTVSNLTLTIVPNSNDTNSIQMNVTNSSISITCLKAGVLHYSFSPIGYTYAPGYQMLSSSITYTQWKQNALVNLINQYLQFYWQYGAPVPSTNDYQRQLLYQSNRVSYALQVSANKTNTITLPKSEPNMQIQAYCSDYNQASTAVQSYNLSGSFTNQHVLLQFQFSRAISAAQLNNLICSISENLQISRHLVGDIQCLQCNINMGYSIKTWSTVLLTNQTYASVSQNNYSSDSSNTVVPVYLNSYVNSNGQFVDVVKLLLTRYSQMGNITTTQQQNLLGKQLVNATTDPELTVLYRTLIVETYNDSSVRPQVTLVANRTSTVLTIKTDSTALLFLTISTNITKLSSPLQLRQGLSGTNIQMQSLITQIGLNQSITIDATKTYYIQYSAINLLANCLSQQYQDPQLIVLPPPAVIAQGLILAVMILWY